jgi:hypothetical protein
MRKSSIVRGVWGSVVVLSLTCSVTRGQVGPTKGLYQIVSGRYSECCGFSSIPFTYALPDAEQRFIELELDSQRNLAQLRVLGPDMRTVFRSGQAPFTGVEFSFKRGIVLGDHVVFDILSLPLPLSARGYLSLIISNSPDALQLNAVVRTPCIGCADIPTEFRHTNVVALLMPTAVVRVKGDAAEVCWNCATNRTYQVQYRSALTTQDWLNAGKPVPGNGATNCITDRVAPGQPERWYRIVTLP